MRNYRVITQIQLILLLLLTGAPFFFIGGPNYHSPRSFIALWDLGHILFFALTSWLLCIVIHYRRAVLSPFSVKLYVFLLVFLVGLTIELLQFSVHGRSPSFGDILRNQLGSLVTFAFILRNKKKKILCLYRLTVVVLVCIALIPLLRATVDELTALRQFPVLANFTTPFEIDRWQPIKLQSMRKSLTDGGIAVLKLQLTTEKYSGASLFYFPGNWQDFNNLFIRIYSPEEENLQLLCRIHDEVHNNNYNDRFNTTFALTKGWNNIVIPIDDIQHGPENRLIDLKNIEELTIFVMYLQNNRSIYISDVHLGS